MEDNFCVSDRGLWLIFLRRRHPFFRCPMTLLVAVIVVVVRVRCQWSCCVVALSSALTMMVFVVYFLLGLDDENEDVNLVFFGGDC